MLSFLVKKGQIALAAVLSMICAVTSVEACTGMKLTAKDGSTVNGRTLEFGIQVDASIAVIPRGTNFVGTTPDGPGMTYKSKYAVVGAIAFDNIAIMDGLNEKGLAVGVFYFPGFAEYATITVDNQSKALSPVEFSNWIITQFATIDEVKAALPNVLIAPTVTKGWGTTPAPFHYIVYDKDGNSLVIEPIKGKLVTYDNKIGTFTNSPTFDWHQTNLANYINLSAVNAKPLTINGVTIQSFGQGSGLVGMPGDFTATSRFVQATIFSATAIPPETSNEAVFHLFHILNQFDIPVGAAREKANGIVYTDYTQVTSVKDPQALKYYFRTYDDQTIKFVDLNEFDLSAPEIKKAGTSGSTPAVNVSKALK